MVAAGLFMTLTILWLLRYITSHAGYLDLGTYEQKIASATLGDYLFPKDSHFSPLSVVGALGYFVHPDAASLLLIQSAALIAAGIALFYFTKSVFVNGSVPGLVLVCFALHPAVHYGWLFDFHPDAFYPLLIFLVFLFSEKGKKWGVFLFGVFALGVKETLTISTGVLGLCLAFRRYLRLLGLILALIGFLIFVLHAALGWSTVTVTSSLLGYLGHSPGEMVVNLITRPSIWISQVFTLPKMFYLYLLFSPLVFVFLRAPLMLVPILPLILISLFSSQPLHSNIHNHYSLGLIPFLFVASVYGLKELSRKSLEKVRVASLSMLFLSVYFSAAVGALPYSMTFWKSHGPFNYQDYVFPTNYDQLVQAVEEVPKNSTLSFQSNLYFSTLIQRPRSWFFPRGLGVAEYVLLDRARAPFVWDEEDGETYEQCRFLLSECYRKIYDVAGIELYHLEATDCCIRLPVRRARSSGQKTTNF